MLLISKELYETGYQVTGEGRRVDIIDSEGKKECEIFFFKDEILIMTFDIVKWTTYTDIKIFVYDEKLTIVAY